MTLKNLCPREQLDVEKRRIFAFDTHELQLDFGIAHRIEFVGNLCNLTLKNISLRRQSVDIRIWVLNNALIELWRQKEKWTTSSLQPCETRHISWQFNPVMPDFIWNQDALDPRPAWIIIDVL